MLLRRSCIPGPARALRSLRPSPLLSGANGWNAVHPRGGFQSRRRGPPEGLTAPAGTRWTASRHSPPAGWGARCGPAAAELLQAIPFQLPSSWPLAARTRSCCGRASAASMWRRRAGLQRLRYGPHCGLHRVCGGAVAVQSRDRGRGPFCRGRLPGGVRRDGGAPRGPSGGVDGFGAAAVLLTLGIRLAVGA
ncbi:hypothetical protein ABIB27_001840 [Arthrobacter sp. UYEF21]